MQGNVDAWSQDSFFAVHNWWHFALYHLELEKIDEVLRLYDGPIFGQRSTVIFDMIDASAMLWRLHLRGIDLGDRWESAGRQLDAAYRRRKLCIQRLSCGNGVRRQPTTQVVAGTARGAARRDGGRRRQRVLRP